MGDPSGWQASYDAGVTNWDLGGPAPPLVRGFDWLEKGRAVVVGCGKGHDALELASRGFDVTAVDFAPGAIAIARESAKKRRLAVDFVQGDVLELPGERAPFDVWVEHTCFCAIDPSDRDGYVRAAEASVRPGGRLLALFHGHLRGGGPPFGTNEAEVRRRFAPGFEVLKLEVHPKDSHPRRHGEEILALFARRV